MTDQEINIAIAEWCGWTNCALVEVYSTGVIKPTGYDLNGKYADIPNYCTDLNAVHEAWKHLKEKQKDKFWGELWEIASLKDQLVRRSKITPDLLYSYVANATARQRCEALLRTIGKWKD